MDRKIRLEQRGQQRRTPVEGETLSVHAAFDGRERTTFKTLERRRRLRRARDVKQAIATLEG